MRDRPKSIDKNTVIFFELHTGTGDRIAEGATGYGVRTLTADPGAINSDRLARISDIDKSLFESCLDLVAELMNITIYIVSIFTDARPVELNDNRVCELGIYDNNVAIEENFMIRKEKFLRAVHNKFSLAVTEDNNH